MGGTGSTTNWRRPADGDANAYRSFFSFSETPDAKKLVLEQVRSWLLQKGWDPDLYRTGYTQRQDSELFVLHHESRTSHEFRMRLREATPLGEWQSELTLSEDRSGKGWIAISVMNSQGRFVDVPRIAAYVLDVIDGFDGPAALTSEPVLMSTVGLDDLLHDLCSESREGLLLVGGTGYETELFHSFQDRVARWARQVRGLARVVVLDPHATVAFEEAVGPSHAVPAWTLRTFLPAVDPAVELDGRRHRIFGTAALAQRPDGAIARILGSAARAHAAARPVPASARKVLRTLTRVESQETVSALDGASTSKDMIDLTASPDSNVDQGVGPDLQLREQDRSHPAVSEQAYAYLAQVELVRRVLGVQELDEPTLRDLAERARRGSQVESAVARVSRQLLEQQARVEELEDEIAYYREYAEEEEFERALVEEERSRLRDQVGWLRARLRAAEDYEAAFGEVPESAYTRYPASFDELVERTGELDQHGVVFCGDERTARSLDDCDSLGKLVRSAWDILLVLCDYVRARSSERWAGGLDGYLSSTPSGFRTVGPKRFAATETGRTMSAFGDERRFPVPRHVDEQGAAVMKAHFKVGRVGMVSPRMYVLDRFPTDGRVYVGYLGPHLTNTQTN